MDQGFEAGSEFISIYDSSTIDSRPHNEPMGADLVVKEGDLVICDATVAGPGGYYSDFARTFSRGAPTAEPNNATKKPMVRCRKRSSSSAPAPAPRRSNPSAKAPARGCPASTASTASVCVFMNRPGCAAAIRKST